MVDTRLVLLVGAVCCLFGAGAAEAMTEDKEQLLSRLQKLRNILENLEEEREIATLEGGYPNKDEYDTDAYNNLSKRNPPSGFSAVRGKRKYPLFPAGYQARSKGYNRLPFDEYKPKRMPYHNGFMASRGKRSMVSAADIKRSPVIKSFVQKSHNMR